MKTKRDFINAIDDLIKEKIVDKSLNEAQKVFCITSLRLLKKDVEAAFRDIKTAKHFKSMK